MTANETSKKTKNETSSHNAYWVVASIASLLVAWGAFTVLQPLPWIAALVAAVGVCLSMMAYIFVALTLLFGGALVPKIAFPSILGVTLGAAAAAGAGVAGVLGIRPKNRVIFGLAVPVVMMTGVFALNRVVKERSEIIQKSSTPPTLKNGV